MGIILQNGKIESLNRGVYNLQVIANGGTVELKYSVGLSAPKTIDGTVFSSDSTKTIIIPTCDITPIITGGAEAALSIVDR